MSRSGTQYDAPRAHTPNLTRLYHVTVTHALLTGRINMAAETKEKRTTLQLQALQSRALPMLPPSQIPALTPLALDAPVRDLNVYAYV